MIGKSGAVGCGQGYWHHGRKGEGVNSSGWQKSSFSAANNECVEVRVCGEVVELRESDEPGTILGRVRSRSLSAQQYVSMNSRTRPSSPTNSYAS
ncbi:DUF397 domain-containing protein [Kitasatospora purpeofusca]|uniref:DUF397 domain-containing protein n=1 Tax=Kitasatospora purpeofusca TaxID=67352 RepID=UPI002253F90A|nr:DUF397 domain-containing protein [Kitasatospora purpeofusca]MCX4754858.1 DUF397 domain-containing protein [Kitasatospora purpeofusca]WSR34244.1 DUF397 domain-containing protein [Kitasatospora purpeofusca]WSR42469.1 DUF397 domain-containing protein [Kitasatospora purpeofusca]